ncbi:MAG: 50S ribosomal protein L21 [Angelakisella sp.]|jgi:large subunit ribosomal protein L21|nr:50S ribosomal protein L21 [Angelakisella sp.]
MYAIFETGGKQYTATAGDVLFIEKLDVEPGQEITFDKVLAVGGEGETTFGAPYLEGAGVTAKVVKNGKGKKITILTYRPKKDSQRKMGHRQPYTKVEILAVNGAGKKKTAKKAAPKAEETAE